MNLYAETSAVVCWLLVEPEIDTVQEGLAGATDIFASELTLLECRRTLVRLTALGSLTQVRAAQARTEVNQAAHGWTVSPLDRPVVDRAAKPFPVEPIRTLDALHLAIALRLRQATPDLALLSLDQRLRDNATALGFDLVPEALPR